MPCITDESDHTNPANDGVWQGSCTILAPICGSLIAEFNQETAIVIGSDNYTSLSKDTPEMKKVFDSLVCSIGVPTPQDWNGNNLK